MSTFNHAVIEFLQQFNIFPLKAAPLKHSFVCALGKLTPALFYCWLCLVMFLTSVGTESWCWGSETCRRTRRPDMFVCHYCFFFYPLIMVSLQEHVLTVQTRSNTHSWEGDCLHFSAGSGPREHAAEAHHFSHFHCAFMLKLHANKSLIQKVSSCKVKKNRK